MNLSLAQLRSALHQYRPADLSDSQSLAHAAVAILLRPSQHVPGTPTAAGTELLMIRRAEHPSDPWSGQMGFPGGRSDAQDATMHCTAIRETREELGLCLHSCTQPLGRLSELRARSKTRILPMSIFPYLCELTGPVELKFNHEVIEAVWIPLDFFLDRANRGRMEHPLEPGQWLPCYRWEQRVIWGLSLMMIDELLELWRPACGRSGVCAISSPKTEE